MSSEWKPLVKMASVCQQDGCFGLKCDECPRSTHFVDGRVGASLDCGQDVGARWRRTAEGLEFECLYRVDDLVFTTRAFDNAWPGWDGDMDAYVGQRARVIDLPRPGVLSLRFDDGRRWGWMADCCRPWFQVGDRVVTSESFDESDKGLGRSRWNEGKAPYLNEPADVVDVTRLGDLRLEFDSGIRLWWRGECCRHVDGWRPLTNAFAAGGLIGCHGLQCSECPRETEGQCPDTGIEWRRTGGALQFRRHGQILGVAVIEQRLRDEAGGVHKCAKCGTELPMTIAQRRAECPGCGWGPDRCWYCRGLLVAQYRGQRRCQDCGNEEVK